MMMMAPKKTQRIKAEGMCMGSRAAAAAATKNSKVKLAWFRSRRECARAHTHALILLLWFVFFRSTVEVRNHLHKRSTEIISYLLFVKRVDLYMGFCERDSFVGHRPICRCCRRCQQL